MADDSHPSKIIAENPHIVALLLRSKILLGFSYKEDLAKC